MQPSAAACLWIFMCVSSVVGKQTDGGVGDLYLHLMRDFFFLCRIFCCEANETCQGSLLSELVSVMSSFSTFFPVLQRAGIYEPAVRRRRRRKAGSLLNISRLAVELTGNWKWRMLTDHRCWRKTSLSLHLLLSPSAAAGVMLSSACLPRFAYTPGGPRRSRYSNIYTLFLYQPSDRCVKRSTSCQRCRKYQPQTAFH